MPNTSQGLARVRHPHAARRIALVALLLAGGCGGGIVGSTLEPIAAPDVTSPLPVVEFEDTVPLITPPSPASPPRVEVAAVGTAASETFAVSVSVGSIQSDRVSASGRFRVSLGASAPAPNNLIAP